MEISKNLQICLQLANNPSISDATFKKLLENCFAVLGGGTEVHNLSSLYNSKPDIIKELYAALLSFTADLVRHNQIKENLTPILTKSLNWSQGKIQQFSDGYLKNKRDIEISLVNIGSHLPHITDINWKIDYVIKSGCMDQGDGPFFHIGLKTEKYDVVESRKKIEYLNFVCTSQELQDFVYKCKDAVRHCQRIGSDH